MTGRLVGDVMPQLCPQALRQALRYLMKRPCARRQWLFRAKDNGHGSPRGTPAGPLCLQVVSTRSKFADAFQGSSFRLMSNRLA